MLLNDKKTKSQSQKEPSSSTAQKNYRFFLPVDDDQFFLAFVLGTCIYSVILTFLFGILSIAFIRLAYRPVPSLVQLVDGQAVRTRPAMGDERTPELIHKFVSDTGSLLFNWTLLTPVYDENGKPVTDEQGKLVFQPDKGKTLDDNSQVTTPVWEASFSLAVEDNYREAFLADTAKLMAQTLWKSRLQTIWEVSQLSEPELLEPGKWRVTAIANCTYIDDRNVTRKVTACNKEFFIRAVDTPPLPLPEIATPLQRLIHRTRSSQMEIYLIKDL
jgi:hypothetical protein